MIECNSRLRKHKSASDSDISGIYISKIKHLIFLSRFKEALIIIDNILGDTLPFDKNFKNINFSFSKEYLNELYFYRGFINNCLKNYTEALRDYHKANQLCYIYKEYEFHTFRDEICHEIEITNKKLYGIVCGSKRNKEYFSNMLKNYPDDFYSLKYLARANYFVDAEESLKNYKTLLKDSIKEHLFSFYFDEKKRAINFWILAIIKCNLKIWKTKKVNREKEILKYLKKADKQINSDTIYVFNKKEAEIFLNYYKFLFYKMTKETEKAKKYFSIEKEKYNKKIFLQRCYLYPKRKLDKIIKNKILSEEYRLLVLKELFCNHNISFKYFKLVCDKWNLKISTEYIEDLKRIMEDEKEGEKRLKYIINKT